MNGWLANFLIAVAPLVLLVALLLLGRYPGEQAIRRIHLALIERPARRSPASIARTDAGFVFTPPGGASLIGRSLAGRAPPGFV